MKTIVKLDITDEERLTIAQSLGQKGMLSRKDVNDLIEGLFAGLKDKAAGAPPKKKGKKVVAKVSVAPIESDSLMEEWLAKALANGMSAGSIYGWKMGWNKEATS